VGNVLAQIEVKSEDACNYQGALLECFERLCMGRTDSVFDIEAVLINSGEGSKLTSKVPLFSIDITGTTRLLTFRDDHEHARRAFDIMKTLEGYNVLQDWVSSEVKV
jgi:hypothetical protein